MGWSCFQAKTSAAERRGSKRSFVVLVLIVFSSVSQTHVPRKRCSSAAGCGAAAGETAGAGETASEIREIFFDHHGVRQHKPGRQTHANQPGTDVSRVTSSVAARLRTSADARRFWKRLFSRRVVTNSSQLPRSRLLVGSSDHFIHTHADHDQVLQSNGIVTGIQDDELL